MALYRHVQTVLQVTTATGEAQTSPGYAVVSGEGERPGQVEPGWAVFYDLSQQGGEGAPGTAVQLETSHDGSSWLAVGSPTQLDRDGETHVLRVLEVLGPYVRARSLLTGTVTPQHTVGVWLASTTPFRLKRVGSGGAGASNTMSGGSSSRVGSTDSGRPGAAGSTFPSVGTPATGSSTPEAPATSGAGNGGASPPEGEPADAARPATDQATAPGTKTADAATWIDDITTAPGVEPADTAASIAGSPAPPEGEPADAAASVSNASPLTPPDPVGGTAPDPVLAGGTAPASRPDGDWAPALTPTGDTPPAPTPALDAPLEGSAAPDAGKPASPGAE